MKTLKAVAALVLAGWLGNTPLHALPLIQQPVSLPANFEGVVTMYPDSANTAQVRRYWIVPSTARIVSAPDPQNPTRKVLQFGLQHQGLTSFEQDGVRALLTTTIQPYVDDTTLNQAKQLVEMQAKSEGATQVTFSFIAPKQTSAWLMVGGHPSDFWTGTAAVKVNGGSVDAGIPFQIQIGDRPDSSFDVRALTQAGAGQASTIGARFEMSFDALADPCSFSITADFNQTYTHFKAAVQASGWFGLAKANVKTEWQNLQGQPFVHLDKHGCSDETLEKFEAKKVLESFLEQLTSQTGFFAPQIHPTGLPDAPGGGGLFGWSVGVGGGYESVVEHRQLQYSVNDQSLVTETITFGFSFPTASAELAPYVNNLSDTGKPFPTSDDIKAVAKQNDKCTTDRITLLTNLHTGGAISNDFYQQQVQAALTRGCYLPVPNLDRISHALGLTSREALKDVSALKALGSTPEKKRNTEAIISVFGK